MLAHRAPGRGWSVKAVTPRGSGRPELSVAPSGRVALAWLSGDDCSGNPTAELHAATGAPAALGRGQLLSSSAVLYPPSGRGVAANRDEALVVWQDAAFENRIMAASAGPSGVFAKAVPISASGGRFPLVAMNAAGAAIVGWTVGTGPTSAQYAYRPAGGAFQQPVTVAAGDSYGPGVSSVAVDGDGDAAIGFGQGPDHMGYVAVRRADGRRLPAQPVMKGGAGLRSVGLAGFLVTGSEMSSSGAGGPRFTGHFAMSHDGGATFSPQEDLPGADGFGAVGTAADLRGNVFSLWYAPPGIPPTLYAASRPAGVGWGSATPLVEGVSGARFAASETGHVLAAWQRLYGDGRTSVVAAGGSIAGDADRARPALLLRTVRRKGRELHVVARCDEPCTLRWRASGRAGGRRWSIRGPAMGASTGEPRSLVVRLPEAARHARARLEVSATDLAGNVKRTVVSR
jgi:hypothetical protein